MGTSRRQFRALLPAAVVACVAGTGPAAPAQDASLEKDLAAARALLKAGKWQSAADALVAVVKTREGSDEVRSRLPEIEEDLKQALYRAKTRPLTPQEIFGKHAKSFSEIGRNLVLKFPDGPAAPEWTKVDEDMWLFGVRFEKSVTVEFTALGASADWTGNLVLLSYDPDRRTGYLLSAGFSGSDEKSSYTLPTRILRLDGTGDGHELKERTDSLPDAREYPTRFRFVRRDTDLEISTESYWARSSPPRFDKPFAARDSKYRGGLVAVRTTGAAELAISGAVDEVAVKTSFARAHENRFREWVKKGYDRSAVLPPWAAAAAGPRVSTGAPQDLPPDVFEGHAPAARAAVAQWNRGDRAGYLKSARAVRLDPGPSLTYMQGLYALGARSPGEAYERFTAVLEEHPGFGPARLYRAEASFRRGDAEAARADLAAATPDVGAYAALYELRIGMGVSADDLSAVRSAVDDARRRGVSSPDLEFFGGWIVRAARGPAWAKRYDYANEVTNVSSDHSQVLARDVGVEIGSATEACRRHFGWKRPGAKPVRSYVFATREGFLEYSGDLGRDLHHAAGAFMPRTRELVLFMPDLARASFWRTVRHEATHAFLDEFMKETPIWFNEGYAQWIEEAGGRTQAANIGGIEAGAVEVLEVALKAGLLPPVKELMLKAPDEFMANAQLYYPYSLALITLFNRDGSAWRAPLKTYAEALRAGASQEKAFADVFEKDASRIDEAFRLFVLRLREK
jgi:hypothetical protein